MTLLPYHFAPSFFPCPRTLFLISKCLGDDMRVTACANRDLEDDFHQRFRNTADYTFPETYS